MCYFVSIVFCYTGQFSLMFHLLQSNTRAGLVQLTGVHYVAREDGSMEVSNMVIICGKETNISCH